MHMNPIKTPSTQCEQQRKLNQKLQGHYGLTGTPRLCSGKRILPWSRFALLEERYPLAQARVVCSIYGR